MPLLSALVPYPLRLALRRVAKAYTPVDLGDVISDERFWDQLSQVRELKRFMFQENVNIKPEDLPKVSLDHLERLSFSPYGRPPNGEEWDFLDAKQSVLSGYLDDRLRWKIKLLHLRVYFTTCPIAFLSIAVAALVHGALRTIFNDALSFHSAAMLYASAVILWTLALGGLGACAFLGTTMISETTRMNGLLPLAQGDGKPAETDFDLTDRNLIGTRIIIGILFAFLLGIPVSAGSLKFVVSQISDGDITAVKVDGTLAMTIALTLLPFVIGFSTTLVLGVMDRFVAAVRTVFGMTAK